MAPGWHAAATAGALLLLLPALPLPGFGGDPPPEGGGMTILEATPEAPWPAYGRDMARSHNAGTPATGLDISDLSPRWRASPLPQTTGHYSRGAVADLNESPGVEVLVTRATTFGFSEDAGALELFSAEGQRLWSVELEVSANAPLVGDLDGDEALEIFISHGKENSLYDADGNLLWRTTLDKPTHKRATIPVALDINDDGVLDLIVNTLPRDHESHPLEHEIEELKGNTEERAELVGLDGRDGTVLFREVTPCGYMWHEPVAVVVAEGPIILDGCVDFAAEEYGPRAGTIKALTFEERPPPQNQEEELREELGLREPYRAVTLWEHQLFDGDLTLDRLTLGDVHPSPGRELVAFWSDNYVNTNLGTSVLTLDGELLVEHLSDEVPLLAREPAVTDLDGDGLQDIVFPNGDTLRAYRMTAEGPELVWTRDEDPGFGPSGVSTSDLDADGSPELIASYQGRADHEPWSASYRVYDGNGTMLWRHDVVRAEWEGPLPFPIRSPLIADLDLDGTHQVISIAQEQVLAFGAPVDNAPGGTPP